MMSHMGVLKAASDWLQGPHLVLQLVLPVHLVLGDVEVVGGVVVDGLHEPEHNVHGGLGMRRRGGFGAEAFYRRGTHISPNRYGSGGSGGDGGGSGGGGAPQGCWLLLPTANICWKLMSVWVQLSTQSAMPMVTSPAGLAGPARLRTPRLRMLDRKGSCRSRVGSPERRDSSFACNRTGSSVEHDVTCDRGTTNVRGGKIALMFYSGIFDL